MSETESSIPEASRIDPFVCPRGHHAVRLWVNRFDCKTCRHQDLEPCSWEKSKLVDLREEDPPLADDADTASEVFYGP